MNEERNKFVFLIMTFFRRLIKAGRFIYKRPRGFADYCSGLFSALIKSKRVLGLPVHITIEPTNICNLRCPICETGSGTLNRPKGEMQFGNFESIIDKIKDCANSIFFYYMGEPFLNKDCYKMIKYAKRKGLYITSCTNGNYTDAAQLLDSGIDEIIFEIGGIIQQTHEKYRFGSNLQVILENVKKLIQQKKSLKRAYPKVILGLIVMKQNESEISKFYELARILGVDEARLQKPCVRTWEQAKQFLPNNEKYWDYDKDAFSKGKLKPKKNSGNRCNWIYISMAILNNGDVVPCCRDVHGDFVMGNILRDDLRAIWNGKKYRNFRKRVASDKNGISICKLCSSFEIPGLYENRKAG